MDASLVWSLRLGVALVSESGGGFSLRGLQRHITLGRIGPGLFAAIRQLGDEGGHEDDLSGLVMRADGSEGSARFRALLGQLGEAGLLRLSAVSDPARPRERLATLMPISRDFRFSIRDVDAGREYVLSRFAYVRHERGEALLECPLSHARLILHDWRAAALVHHLARPSRSDAFGRIPALEPGAAGGLVALLIGAGMLCALDDRGISPEDESAVLRPWEFHDLLFHARSRQGRHDHRHGGTYRFLGDLAPPPALKLAEPGESIELSRPDLDRLEREDRPFAWVQEARCSIRKYADRPISDRQLGEFLYRVGRVADRWVHVLSSPRGPSTLEFAPRPYPGGGGLYELELYVVIHTCQSIESGLYHYDPGAHRLVRIPARTGAVEELLAGAGRATGIPAEGLQTLIVIAARFQRVSWKYESIAYSTILKNVGILMQTMYLVATAMDLAPCGVGSGDADLFAAAAGTDYYSETSVGEFLLGSKE